jgi:glycosyltransferase involved in cell wall biosynthesis
MQATISVLMPMYNAEKFVSLCLAPLLEMKQRGEIAEILVVDDCSTDASPSIVSKMDVRVIRTPQQGGPGAARNLGVLETQGDLVWFVDSDVVVADDAAGQVAAGFNEDGVGAVFGSYDECPGANNFLSQYKNLVHHYYHQGGREDASTFWAGCGAVRKEVFLDVGGFDVESYPYPSIEDIELGYRIRAAGHRIRLIPNLQGTHLKDWRFVNLIHTEVFRRAIPWSRLMLRSKHITDDLNVGIAERLRAALAGAGVLSVAAWLTGLIPGWSVAFSLAVVAIANIRFLKFFYRRRGALFALRAFSFHQLYYLYSSAAFAFAFLEHLFTRSKRPTS